MDNIAICEMSELDIKNELSARCFELLDWTLNKDYRIWIIHRIRALEFELEERTGVGIYGEKND